MIKPNFLNGKNNDDLAPITTLISPFVIPLQIISFFFFVIPECQTAGAKPKHSRNFFQIGLLGQSQVIKLSPENLYLLFL